MTPVPPDVGAFAFAAACAGRVVTESHPQVGRTAPAGRGGARAAHYHAGMPAFSMLPRPCALPNRP